MLDTSRRMLVALVCAVLVTAGCSTSTGGSTGAANTVDEASAEEVLTLAPGGRVLLDGEDVSTLPYEQAIVRLTQVLGEPDETTPVGSACETHVSLGFAVRWNDFRVLVQTEDNPYGGGNARKGHIAGWDLNYVWVEDPVNSSFTMNGLSLGSTLGAARLAFPDAEEGEGDGDWVLRIDSGPDVLSGASLHFETDSPDARAQFMDSGYACGS